MLDLPVLLHPLFASPLVIEAPVLRHFCSLNGTCMRSRHFPHTSLQREAGR